MLLKLVLEDAPVALGLEEPLLRFRVRIMIRLSPDCRVVCGDNDSILEGDRDKSPFHISIRITKETKLDLLISLRSLGTIFTQV